MRFEAFGGPARHVFLHILVDAEDFLDDDDAALAVTVSLGVQARRTRTRRSLISSLMVSDTVGLPMAFMCMAGDISPIRDGQINARL